MIIIEHYFPNSLSAKRLDKYLAAGWFRSANMLFRSTLLCLEGQIFSPVNIRIKLEGHKFRKSHRKLLNKNKKKFNVVIRPLKIDEHKERLYNFQKVKFKGFIIDTLEEYLLSGGYGDHLFNTYEVCVFDQEELVAVSFFDIGEETIASIIALYDPSYEKYSLGNFTMLMEIDFAIKSDKKFFYPGYTFDKPSSFDYKLNFGKTYYYNWKGRWRNMKYLPSEKHNSEIIEEKTDALKMLLCEYNIHFVEYLYPLFSLNFLDYTPDNIMRNPLFLELKDNPKKEEKVIVEFDLIKNKYQIYKVCILSFYKGLFSDTYLEEDLGVQALLEVHTYEQEIFTSENIKEVLEAIKKI